jgi:SAM-dependent methyltransferase
MRALIRLPSVNVSGAGEFNFLNTAEHARRASSFGGSAADYARHRPDYPIAALHWGLPDDAARPRVADLAAGTGKLTAGLLRCSARVVAIEPDAAMLAELRDELPSVPVLRAGAEHLPLAGACLDAVCVGQAFHWFDAALTLPELARVLRPGGVLLAMWNYTDRRVGWAAELERARNNTGSWARHPRGQSVPAHPAFTVVQQRTFEHTQRRTARSMLATAATHSNMLVLPEREREQALAGLTSFLAECPETSSGEFDLPLCTTVVRMIRG